MHDIPALNAALSELFAEDVRTEVLRRQQLEDASLFIAEMRYTRRNDSGPSVSVKQTAIVLQDSQLDLPQFVVSPRQSGLIGLALKLMGWGHITFDDSPEFSEMFRLHAWNETAVRILFTRELRSCFEQHSRWSARGARDWIVLYREGFICESSALDAFVADSLPLMEEFQRGEEALDARPELSRKVEMSDVVSTLEASGGFAASFLKRQLQKHQVTPHDLSCFLAQPTPRHSIPAGLRRQVIGDNFMLVVIGMLFLIVGVAVPIPLAIQGEGDARLIGMILGSLFTLVGGCIAFFTLWYRSGRKRLLRDGLLADGIVRNVKRTSVEVNGATKYDVQIDYLLNGKQLTTVMPLYMNVEKARELMSTGKSAKLLVDPKNRLTVVCLDTLLVFE